VLGVDDDEILCNLCRPRLSNVVPDAEGIGYLAGKTLQAMRRGEKVRDTPRLVRSICIRTRESADAAASSDWHVSRALRFMHGNATRDIGVADVVAQAHSSRRFLEKQFQAVVGRTLHHEILRERLETSQHLLITSRLLLKEAAARSDLRRADYISSVYREKLGSHPANIASDSAPKINLRKLCRTPCLVFLQTVHDRRAYISVSRFDSI
jgi:LacI family transcriptional regulator